MKEYCHKKTYIQRYEIIDYVLNNPSSFVIKINNEYIHFIDGFSAYKHIMIANKMITTPYKRSLGEILLNHSIDDIKGIDIYSKIRILLNRDMDKLCKNYTRYHIMSELRNLLLLMYVSDSRTRYENYLQLVIQAKAFNIIDADYVEYSRERLCDTVEDRTLYKAIDGIIKTMTI
jgi:hypothetical protein